MNTLHGFTVPISIVRRNWLLKMAEALCAVCDESVEHGLQKTAASVAERRGERE